MAPPPTVRRPGFSRRAQYSLFFSYVIAVGGVVLGAVLLVLSIVDPNAFAVARGAVGDVTTPVASTLDTGRRFVTAIPTAIGDYVCAGSQNAALRAEAAANRTRLIEARAIALENARLRRLLRVQDPRVATVAVARLVASSASSTRRFAVLNAGRLQGVRSGQPVRGPEGLVGRVLETGLGNARVLLLTDPDSVVPVRRTRDGFPAIAAGRGDGFVELRSVELRARAFKPGDVFVTSGAGGLYAPNIPVAQVTRLGDDTAVARPFVDPDTLDFASVQAPYVVMPPPRVMPGQP